MVIFRDFDLLYLGWGLEIFIFYKYFEGFCSKSLENIFVGNFGIVGGSLNSSFMMNDFVFVGVNLYCVCFY